MVKSPTLWKPGDSGIATSANTGLDLLLETSSHLLLETGFDLLLEDTVITAKNPTSWATPTKSATSWRASDGFTSYSPDAGEVLATQAGDTVITQAGDTRVLQDAVAVPKAPTRWSET